MVDKQALADLEELVENLRSTPCVAALRSLNAMHTSKTDPLNVDDLLAQCPPSHIDQFSAAVLACLPEVPAFLAEPTADAPMLDAEDWHALSIGATFCGIALRMLAKCQPENDDKTPVNESTLALASRLQDALPPAPRAVRGGLLRAMEPLLSQKAPLGGNLLPALVRHALEHESNATDVKRVHAARARLAPLDLRRGGAHDALRAQLLRCASAPQFVRVADGQNFVAYLLTLSTLRSGVFDAIMNALATVRKSQAASIGRIFLLAWRAKGADRFRATMFNLTERAVLASSEPLATNLRTVLAAFHSNKRLPNMDAMLSGVYAPIVLPNLLVANPFVRRNAVTILCSAYPVHDPGASRSELESTIHRQTDKLIELLDDPQPLVRIATVQGVCSVLASLFAIVPLAKATKMMEIITTKCAFDSSSAAVRIAALQGLKHMLDNHETYALLTIALPRLRQLIHDAVERVRIAMLELLVKLKSKRVVKLPYISVVPVDQLLLRLPDDSQPVVSLIMQLIVTSYFPLEKRDKSPSEIAKSQYRACVAMLGQNNRAAESFYKLLYIYIPPNRLVGFSMTVASKAIDMADGKAVDEKELLPVPVKEPQRKLRSSKRNQTQKKRARTALTEGKSNENKEKTQKQNTAAQLLAVAADVLQSLTPFLSKDKELSRKLRQYVNKIFDAPSLKPYLSYSKYSRTIRAAMWRIASCLQVNKAKPLFAIWKEELYSIGQSLHSLTKENEKEETLDVLVSLLSCGMTWKRYATMSSVFGKWADQVENPTFAVEAKNMKVKASKKKASMSKSKRKSGGAQFKEQPGVSSLTIGLTAIVISVDALTNNLTLQQKYSVLLKELKEKGENSATKKNAENSPAQIHQLVSTILRACKCAVNASVQREADDSQIAPAAQELALTGVSAAWQVLLIGMAEGTYSEVSLEVDSFLEWCTKSTALDSANTSISHATFTASFAAVTLSHSADAIALGALSEKALHHVDRFVQRTCIALKAHSHPYMAHFITAILRISVLLGDHAEYAEALREIVKRKDEPGNVSRPSALWEVRDSVLSAALSLLASIDDDPDAEFDLARQPLLIYSLGDSLCALDAKRGPGVLREPLTRALNAERTENAFSSMLTLVFRRQLSRAERVWNNVESARIIRMCFGTLVDGGSAGAAARFACLLARNVMEDIPIEGDRLADALTALASCLRPLIDCVPTGSPNKLIIGDDENISGDHVAQSVEEAMSAISDLESRLLQIRSGGENAPTRKGGKDIDQEHIGSEPDT